MSVAKVGIRPPSRAAALANRIEARAIRPLDAAQPIIQIAQRRYFVLAGP
ncbi:MAG: hypothetical protein ABIZ52_01530 [Candidatus Limnocylindrales bacterium]